MKRNLLHLICAAVLLTMTSCGGNGGDTPPEPESFVPAKAPRGFLLYLAVDNTLAHMGKANLEAVTEGANAQTLGDGVIFVFHDDPHDVTRLYAIYIDPTTKKTQRKEVKNYSANLDTSSPATFKRVWDDIQKITKVEKWVLSFGSHGNGWIPNQSLARSKSMPWDIVPRMGTPRKDGKVGTRALLQDQYRETTMDIADFANMLPAVETIIMDACDMGAIEFAYILRNKAKYLILSPAEVIDEGFPYKSMIADLFNPDSFAGAQAICEKFYNHYYNFFDTGAQYGTVSLFDCSKFDAYAAAVKTALAGKKETIEKLSMKTLEGIQHVDRSEFAAGKVIHICYDMKEFLSTVDSWTPAVEAAHKALIPHCYTTGKSFYDLIIIPKDRFSGVSTYIPSLASNFVGDLPINDPNEDPDIIYLRNVHGWLNGWWVKTEWAKAIGMGV